MKRWFNSEGRRVHRRGQLDPNWPNWRYQPFNGRFPTRVQWVVLAGGERYGYYGKPCTQTFRRFLRLLRKPGITFARIAEFDAAAELWNGVWNKRGDGVQPERVLTQLVARTGHQRKLFTYYPELGGQQVQRAWLGEERFITSTSPNLTKLHGRTIVSYFTPRQVANNAWQRELDINAQELQRQHPWRVRAAQPAVVGIGANIGVEEPRLLDQLAEMQRIVAQAQAQQNIFWGQVAPQVGGADNPVQAAGNVLEWPWVR